ncbi:MAG: GntR family transcriptional regulator [Pseudomonadota bacterium]
MNDLTRAYRAIRNSLGDYQLPPGRQIPVRVIADNLGMSITSVKEACGLLTDEGWAVPGTRAAFFAWRPEANAIAGLYDANRAILMSALDHANADADGARAAILKIRRKLAGRELSNTTLAAYTGALFFAIVECDGEPANVDLVRLANERLYYLRILECRYFVNTASELMVLCDLLLAGCRDDLRQAIAGYHERRRSRVPDLYGMLAAR